MTCPNHNDPKWKVLDAALGTRVALTAYNRNNEEIPTLEKARELLSVPKKSLNSIVLSYGIQDTGFFNSNVNTTELQKDLINSGYNIKVRIAKSNSPFLVDGQGMLNYDRIKKEYNKLQSVDFTSNVPNKYNPERSLAINRILTSILLTELDPSKSKIATLDKKNIADFISDVLKNIALDQFNEGVITVEQKDDLLSVSEDFILNTDNITQRFFNYVDYNYGIALSKDYETFVSRDLGEIKEDWDNAKLFRNPKETVANKVKIRLASIIDEEDINEFGIATPIDINDVYNTLVWYHHNDETSADMLKTLDKLANYVSPVFAKIADELNDSLDLQTDLKYDFINAYKQVMFHDVTNDKIFILNTESDNKLSVDLIDNNRWANPTLIYWDKISDHIKGKFDKGLYKTTTRFGENNNPSIEQVQKTLSYFGINVRSNFINDFMTEPEFAVKKSEFIKALNETVKEFNKMLDKQLKNPTKPISFEIKGYLRTVLDSISDGLPLLTRFSYSNVNGDIQQSVQQSNYLTDLFRQFTKSNTKPIEDRFLPYTQVPNFKHSNWLWSQQGKQNGFFYPISYNSGQPIEYFYNSNNEEIDKSDALTNGYAYTLYKIDRTQGINGINIDFINAFQVSLFGGTKDRTLDKGTSYDKLFGNAYDYISFIDYIRPTRKGEAVRWTSLLPVSDAGRTYTLLAPYQVGSLEFDKTGNLVSLGQDTMTTVKNTIYQQLEDYYNNINEIFELGNPSDNINEFVDGRLTGQLRVKQQYTKNGSKYYNLHTTKHGQVDKQGNFTLIKNNKLLGKVFNIDNISYVENGNKVTLNDVIGNERLINQLNFNSAKEAFNDIIEEFITKAIKYKVNKFSNKLSNSKSKILNSVAYKDKNGKKIPFIDKATKEEAEIELNKQITKFVIDDYLHRVESGNIIYGNNSEYTSVLDWNKRVNQTIRPGLRHNGEHSNNTFRVLHAQDIELPSRLPKQLGTYMSDRIKNQYSKSITTTDGFSVATIDMYINFLKAAGRYEEFKPTIDSLLDPNTPFNPKDYNNFIESQKYFMYERKLDERAPVPSMTSYQFKNSIMVLTPKLVKGTEWERLYNSMNEAKIDQINFNSATKIGGVHSIKIHDENGSFITNPNLDQWRNAATIHAISNVRIQQDIPSHILDDTNKLGVQLSKLILTNLDLGNSSYMFNGNPVTGKQLFDKFSQLISDNIIDSSDEVFKSFMVVDENGDIAITMTGDIIVNIPAFTKYIRDYVQTSTDNFNMLNSIEYNEITDDSNISLFASVNSKKFIQIILSKFTSNIIDQSLPGMSLPLVPEMFLAPNIEFLDDGKLINNKLDESFFDKTRFTFTKEKEQEIRDTGKFELNLIKGYKNGQLVSGYEAIVNPYLAKWFKEGDIVDIKDVPDEALEMLGIRIPTEGKQSVPLIKIVGFMNSGASQIILPYDLITTTGWDYDIDKLFVYYKHLDANNNVIKANADTVTSYVKYLTDKISEDLTNAEYLTLTGATGNNQESIDRLNAIATKYKVNSYDKFLSRQIRDNEILDLMMSVIKSEVHVNEITKSNDFPHIEEVSNAINDKAGFNTKNYDVNDITDNIALRTLNIQTRSLKGIAVATKGFYDIAAVVKAKFNKSLVPEIIVEKTDMDLSKLRSVFEDDDYTIESNIVRIKDSYIANNAFGTNTDMSGNLHSDQLGEMIANILDAVKKPMYFNLGDHTIGVAMVLASNNTIFNFKGEANRFAYGAYFLSQPVITEFIEDMNDTLSNNTSKYTTLQNMSDDYIRNILNNAYKTDKAKFIEVVNKIAIEKPNLKLETVLKALKGRMNNTNRNLLDSMYNDLFNTKDLITFSKLQEHFNNYYDDPSYNNNSDNKIFQYEVLKRYIQYEDMAGVITKAVSTYNVDKQSIGPNTSKYKKLSNNILYEIINPSDIRSKLNDIEFPLSRVNEIVSEYMSLPSTQQKYEYWISIKKEVEDKTGKQLRDGTADLFAGDIPMIKAIYPSQFGLDLKSVYPILETYLQYGFEKANQLIEKTMLFETKEIKKLKSIIFETLSDKNIEDIDNSLNSFVLRYLSKDLQYFNQAYHVDIERIFGISKSDSDTNKIDITNNEHINEFNKLSVCDKVRLLNNNAEYLNYITDDRFKNSHILLSLIPLDSKDRLEQYGYESIKYIESDENQNLQIASMLDMHYSENPYLRSVFDDLVKYSYFSNGFEYGSNISKVIPANLMFTDNINVDRNSLQYYSFHMSKKLSDSRAGTLIINEDLQEVIRDYSKQNFADKIINPRIKTNKGAKDSPKFTLIDLDKTKYAPNSKSDLKSNFKVIIEPKYLVDKSYVSKNNTVTYKLDDGTKKGKLLLLERTLHKFKVGNKEDLYYVYTPINKQLKGEFGGTKISSFKEHDELEYSILITKLERESRIPSLINNTIGTEDNVELLLESIQGINSQYINDYYGNTQLEYMDNEGGEESIVPLSMSHPINYDNLVKLAGLVAEYDKTYDKNGMLFMYDTVKNNVPTTHQKRVKFEIAKAKNNDISILDSTTNTEYKYNYDTNSFNESKVKTSNDILSDLIDELKIKSDNKQDLIDYIILRYADQTGNGPVFLAALRNEYPELTSRFEASGALENNRFESREIYIARDITTTQNIQDLSNISDIVLHIGEGTSFGKNIVDKNKLFVIDYNKSINNVFEDIKSKIGTSKTITIGIIGENMIKSQGFYDNYTNRLINKLVNKYNYNVKLITTDNEGVSQAVINNILDIPTLTLTTNNKFEKRANREILHSDELNTESLDDKNLLVTEEVEELDSLLKLNNIHKTSEAIFDGLVNIKRAQYEFWGNNNNISKDINIAGSAIKFKLLKDVLNSNKQQELLGITKLYESAEKTVVHLNQLYNEIKDLDMSIMFDIENNTKRMDFANTVNQAITLKNTIQYIDNLVLLEATNEDNKKINTIINAIKSSKLKIDNKINLINNKYDEFITQNLTQLSRNPKYITVFSKIKDKIKADRIGTSLENTEITDLDLINNFKFAMTSQEDITWSMLNFDSPFVTGVSLIDVTMNDYFIQKDDSMRKADNLKDKLYTTLSTFYGVDKKKLGRSDDGRSDKFKRLLNRYGNFISDVAWDKFEDSQTELKHQVSELEKAHYNTTDKAEQQRIAKEIKDITYKWLTDNVDGFTITIDTNGNTSVNPTDDIKLDSKILNEIENIKSQGNNQRYYSYLKANRIFNVSSKFIKLSTSHIKLKPNIKYKTNDYSKLTDSEKQLITDLKSLMKEINELNMDVYNLNEDMFPKILTPKWQNSVKEIFGISHVKEDNTMLGVNNAIRYYVEAPYIKDFEFEKVLDISRKNQDETQDEYNNRLVKSANIQMTNYTGDKTVFSKYGEFKTKEEVYKYNNEVKKYNSKTTADNLITDPLFAISNYIDGTSNFKFINGFYKHILNVLDKTKEIELGIPNSPKDKLMSIINRKQVSRKITGEESNAHKKLQSLIPNLFNDPVVKTKLDKVMNVTYRWTGSTYMAFGIINGIKNVMTGYLNIITEASGGQFVNNKELGSATALYMTKIMEVLSSSGSEYSNDLEVALMKAAADIYQDTSEGNINSADYPNLAGNIKWMYDASYFANNAGEHFMQFSMYLAALESHKIYNNKVFSRHEFIEGANRAAIEKNLTKDQIDSLNKYIDRKKNRKDYDVQEHPFIVEWLTINKKDIAINKILKDIDIIGKQALKDFEALPTVKSQFEVVNGRSKLKANALINDNDFVNFKTRIRGVNQYMHGIYSSIDKGVFQQTMMGVMAMQFRKWMRPNWNRYYGTKLGKEVFNEQLGLYQKGVYHSLLQLFNVPNRIREGQNQNEKDTTIMGYLKLTGDVIANLRHVVWNYKVSLEQDKANIKIALTNILEIVGMIGSVSILLALAGDDDDEQKQAIHDSKALAFILYMQYSVSSEIAQMLPHMLLTTITKMRQNTMATESVLLDVLGLLQTTVKYPFLDEEDKTYHQGIYKNANKWDIQFSKVMPGFRQDNKWNYIESYTNWYKQYSPIGF